MIKVCLEVAGPAVLAALAPGPEEAVLVLAAGFLAG